MLDRGEALGRGATRQRRETAATPARPEPAAVEAGLSHRRRAARLQGVWTTTGKLRVQTSELGIAY